MDSGQRPQGDILLLGEVARGQDPSEKRSLDRVAMTFRELCDLYLTDQ